MGVRFYMDVNIHGSISDQLRRRGVDVLTAQEDGYRQASDEVVLERARELGRIVFTHDIGFRVMAEQWQSKKREFPGLAYAHEANARIGRYIEDLYLIAQATDPEEWRNFVQYLPL